MLKVRPSRVIMVLMACWTASVASAARMEGLIDRIQRAERSMVVVRTELVRTMPTNPPRAATFYRTAAGIVVDPSGLIVTNTHTIVDAPAIFVVLRDGTKLPAQVVAVCVGYDFSLLRIHPPHPLQAVRWANSSMMAVGDPIVVVGNSDYDNRSIMSGHIKNILQSGSSLTNDFLELDLDLYPGDSGGPVFDRQGRLVGMIMAKRTSQAGSSIAIICDKIRLEYLQYKENMQ